MIKLARQICAAAAAVAMTATPVLSCCLGMAAEAHAASESRPSGQPSASMPDHCAGHTPQSVGATEPGDDEAHGCDACDSVQLKAQALTGISTGLTAVPDMVPSAAVAHSRPDFMPALLRTVAPPQGPPLVHRTPVYLNTTLRL